MTATQMQKFGKGCECIWMDNPLLTLACVSLRASMIFRHPVELLISSQLQCSAFASTSMFVFAVLFFYFSFFFIVEIKSPVAFLKKILAIQSTSCRDRLLSYSLFNWSGLKGVLHKAAESTAGVCVSGVRAKFSKSSQCVPQWQHMLESLQRNSRMHNLTCEDTTDTQVPCTVTVTDERGVLTCTRAHSFLGDARKWGKWSLDAFKEAGCSKSSAS